MFSWICSNCKPIKMEKSCGCLYPYIFGCPVEQLHLVALLVNPRPIMVYKLKSQLQYSLQEAQQDKARGAGGKIQCKRTKGLWIVVIFKLFFQLLFCVLYLKWPFLCNTASLQFQQSSSRLHNLGKTCEGGERQESPTVISKPNLYDTMIQSAGVNMKAKKPDLGCYFSNVPGD